VIEWVRWSRRSVRTRAIILKIDAEMLSKLPWVFGTLGQKLSSKGFLTDDRASFEDHLHP
jgi:hypothetical protein